MSLPRKVTWLWDSHKIHYRPLSTIYHPRSYLITNLTYKKTPMVTTCRQWITNSLYDEQIARKHIPIRISSWSSCQCKVLAWWMICRRHCFAIWNTFLYWTRWEQVRKDHTTIDICDIYCINPSLIGQLQNNIHNHRTAIMHQHW